MSDPRFYFCDCCKGQQSHPTYEPGIDRCRQCALAFREGCTAMLRQIQAYLDELDREEGPTGANGKDASGTE